MWTTKKALIYIGIPLGGFLIVTTIALLFIFCFNNSGSAVPVSDKGPKLVIDHDGGADDALAITMSLLYEKYFNGPKVVALTTSYGNVNLSQTIVNSARILELCDRTDIPIYKGAERTLISGIVSDYFFGYDGLGDDGYTRPEPVKLQSVHSAIALIQLSKIYEGDLIIMSIGPATNLALAIRMDPGFIDRLAQLYVGAGHLHSTSHNEPEFNADMDPEAYYIVAESAKVDKVTFVPFSQIYGSMNVTKEWRQNVLGTIDTPIMKALNGYERLSLAAASVWTLLDPAVAAVVLNNSVVTEFKNTTNGIVLCGEERGINTNNLTTTEPNSRLVYSGSVDKYKQLLIDIYSAELTQRKENCP